MTVPVLTPADIAACRAEEEAEARRPRPTMPRAHPDADPALAGFRVLLRRHRDARRWSQERLALEAECDHSLVSRIESGHRSPTRDVIGKLAVGLDLDQAATEKLYLTAGYLPPTIDAADLAGAVGLLRDTTAAERGAALALIAAARKL